MNRWVTRIIEGHSPDSVPKARQDVSTIGGTMGYQPTYIYRYIDENENEQALQSRIDGITAGIAKDDLLIYQYPSYNGDRFDRTFLHLMHARGIKVAFLIHDTELLRGDIYFDELSLFREVDILIIHGQRMKERFEALGLKTPMVSKELFDYLPSEDCPEPSQSIQKKLIFAGNLEKSIFLTKWNNQYNILAFGQKGTIQLSPNVEHAGVFQQKELIRVIPNDGIGVAWDDNLESGGRYQTYTRYNAPHKISLYLSLGMPVIVWDQSAVAETILKYNLGFTISSPDEIDDLLNNISEEELQTIKRNVLRFSQTLKEGFFTRSALMETEKLILFKDLVD